MSKNRLVGVRSPVRVNGGVAASATLAARPTPVSTIPPQNTPSPPARARRASRRAATGPPQRAAFTFSTEPGHELEATVGGDQRVAVVDNGLVRARPADTELAGHLRDRVEIGGRFNGLVETQRGSESLGDAGVPGQIVGRKGLFDVVESERIERPQGIDTVPGRVVRAVGVDGDVEPGKGVANGDHPRLAARSDLELHTPIPRGLRVADAPDEPVDVVREAERQARVDPLGRRAEEGGEGTFGASKVRVEQGRDQPGARHSVALDVGECAVDPLEQVAGRAFALRAEPARDQVVGEHRRGAGRVLRGVRRLGERRGLAPADQPLGVDPHQDRVSGREAAGARAPRRAQGDRDPMDFDALDPQAIEGEGWLVDIARLPARAVSPLGAQRGSGRLVAASGTATPRSRPQRSSRRRRRRRFGTRRAGCRPRPTRTPPVHSRRR